MGGKIASGPSQQKACKQEAMTAYANKHAIVDNDGGRWHANVHLKLCRNICLLGTGLDLVDVGWLPAVGQPQTVIYPTASPAVSHKTRSDQND